MYPQVWPVARRFVWTSILRYDPKPSVTFSFSPILFVGEYRRRRVAAADLVEMLENFLNL